MCSIQSETALLLARVLDRDADGQEGSADAAGDTIRFCLRNSTAAGNRATTQFWPFAKVLDAAGATLPRGQQQKPRTGH
jgi:hypothetical protein